MDEADGSSMLDGTDFVARLNATEDRLEELARAPVTDGLTEPDPGGTERWEAAQVWAHMAEFVRYWHEQVESVIGAYDGEPVPFGRTKTDPDRIEGIEMGRHEPVAELRSAVHDEVEELKRYLAGLTSAEWNAIGLHVRRGPMDVEAIIEEFVVKHLEEHADQLQDLS